MHNLQIIIIISERGLKICEGLKLFMYKSTPTDSIPGHAGESGRERSTTEPGGSGVQDDGGKQKVERKRGTSKGSLM